MYWSSSDIFGFFSVEFENMKSLLSPRCRVSRGCPASSGDGWGFPALERDRRVWYICWGTTLTDLYLWERINHHRPHPFLLTEVLFSPLLSKQGPRNKMSQGWLVFSLYLSNIECDHSIREEVVFWKRYWWNEVMDRTRLLALLLSTRTGAPPTGKEFCVTQGGQSLWLHPHKTELHVKGICSCAGDIFHFNRGNLLSYC